jgi:predicted phage gp36 major capsid-like protein
MSTSKTPAKPEPVVDESGRKVYPGSLSMTTELTPGQKDKILSMLKQEAHTPTSLVAAVDGLSQYNLHAGEAVRRWLAQLETAGTIQQAKDSNGKLIGWQAVADKE